MCHFNTVIYIDIFTNDAFFHVIIALYYMILYHGEMLAMTRSNSAP